MAKLPKPKELNFMEFKLALSTKVEEYNKETNGQDDPKQPTKMTFEEWMEDLNGFINNENEENDEDEE